MCDVHYSFNETELFIIPNAQTLNIPYLFADLTRYSLFIIPLPPPNKLVKKYDHPGECSPEWKSSSESVRLF